MSGSTPATRSRHHVVVVAHALYPLSEPRAERAVIAAAESGYRVTVLAVRGPGESAREVDGHTTIVRVGQPRDRSRSALSKLLEYVQFTVQATRALRRIAAERPIDVVQVHAPPTFLVRAARRLRVPIVLDIRDIEPHLWNARFGTRRLSRPVHSLLWAITRWAARRSDAVITVHGPYRDELVDHGVGTPIEIVMNTPDAALIDAADDLVSNRSAEPGPFTCSYHGTITSWYAVDDLALAVARLHTEGLPVHCQIIGDGDFLPAVRSIVEEHGLSSWFRFTNRHIPRFDALGIVAASSCGVVSATDSELGNFLLSNKLFEYITLGIPVVAASLQTTRVHFDRSEVTFYDPGDPASLAAALRWVKDHPAEAAEKAERARRRLETYSWPAQAERYVALLDKLASGAAR